MQTRLQIRLFGGLQVLDAAGDDLRLPSRNAESLLSLLLVDRERKHPRSSLVGAFWPDLPESRARRRLSQALWQITSVLSPHGESLFIADRESVSLDPEASVWVDIIEFDELIESSTEDDAARFIALLDAVALYRGDLLEGAFDDWALVERSRYRHRLVDAETELVRHLKARGELDEALRIARLVVDYEPLREEAHREVIRLLQLLGRPAEAVEQYDRLQSLLLHEIGSEPEAETRALIERLELTSSEPLVPRPVKPATEPVTSPALVGRDRERAKLIEMLENLLRGDGSTVLIEGETGIGKTRLVSDLVDAAAWRGITTTIGECGELAVAFSAPGDLLRGALPRLRVLQLAEILDPVWLGEIAGLLPDVWSWLPDLEPNAPLEPGDERARRRESVVQALTAAASIKPLVVIVEDLHRADDDLLLIIDGLARAARLEPLLVVLTFRSEQARQHPDIWEMLRRIDQLPGGARLQLDPLDRTGTGALATHLGMDLGADVVGAIHREAGGNPLFTIETLRAVDESGGDISSIPIASTVQSVISRRLELVSPTGRDVLAALAVHADSLGINDIATLSGAAGLGVVSGELEELIARVLLTEEGDNFRFAHAQIRHVVYGELAEPDRRAMHQAVADLLSASAAPDPAKLAHHFEEAGQIDVAARHHAVAAERATAARAFSRAAPHYEAAIDAGWLDTVDHDAQVSLLSGYETTLDVLGERERQGAVADLLIAAATGAPRIDALSRKALQLAHTDRFDIAITTARTAVDDADHMSLGDAAVQARTTLGTILSWSGKSSEALEPLSRAAGDATDATTEAAALHGLGIALVNLQRYDEAIEVLEKAVAVYTDGDVPRGRCESLGILGVALMEQGNDERARACYLEALDQCEALGFRYGEGRNLLNLGNLQHQSGHLGAALASYRRAGDIFRSIGNRRGQVITHLNEANLRQHLFGSDEVAHEAANEAMDYMSVVGDERGQAHCLDVLGRLAIARGDLETAQELLEHGRNKAADSGHRWMEMLVYASLARLALERDDPDSALAHLATAAALATEVGAADMATEIRVLEAEALLVSGDASAAGETAADAVARLTPGVGRRHLAWLQLARASEVLGHADGATAAIEEANTLLQNAVADLEDDDKKRALADVAAHREIVDRYEQSQPSFATVELPAIDAPTGRPLRPDELISVVWTVTHPDDEAIEDHAERRRMRLVRLVGEAREQGGAPTVDDLAESLDVSRSTLRRDLTTLRAQGVDIQTRGARS
ncbi:MAG: AAA family ATPase [Acidimicrobiia bacterium]|nr:AAA family ATPase [Acidimicrobiia bacterium]